MTEQYISYIQKVWKEALSTEEKQWLLRQLTTDAASWKAKLLREYEQNLYNNTEVIPAERSAAILRKLHERIHLMDEAATFTVPEVMPKVLSMHRWKWAAGIAAAVLGLSWLLWQPSRRETVRVAGDLLPVYVSADLKKIENKGSVVQTLTLEDGSVVKLSPASSIVWNHHFAGNKRNIRLSGKAWFDVAKNSRKPFSVTTGDITTTALGTKFIVNTLKNGKLAVHLLEGKVVLQSAGLHPMKDVYLKPGQQCVIDQQLMQPQVSDISAPTDVSDSPVAEKNILKRITPLEFVQTPLEEVFNQLGQRYKIHFRYNRKEIGNDQVTGTFLASDPLEVTLKLLTNIHNLSFSQYQDTILVSKLK